MDTQAADLFEGSNNASVLTEDAPAGNYVVETKVRLSVPAEGCCFNYVQAGLVVMANDDEFVKLTHVSIWNTRQTEFAKEVAPNQAGYPRYGNTVVGPPGEWTWLRIVKQTSGSHAASGPYGGRERYTAYTSHDGVTWSKGGTWTHRLGDDARIGLVAMGGSGFVAEFDYVHVSRLRH
jgi:arabinan endo-1,5-alpha-L-arabinosidase